MTDDILYCSDCKGVALFWKEDQWVAPYVEGAVYCSCTDEELVRSKERNDVVNNLRDMREERIDGLLRCLRP